MEISVITYGIATLKQYRMRYTMEYIYLEYNFGEWEREHC